MAKKKCHGALNARQKFLKVEQWIFSFPLFYSKTQLFCSQLKLRLHLKRCVWEKANDIERPWLECSSKNKIQYNGTTHFKNCKQLFEYQHILLLRDIWWSKFQSILKSS
jgi:hypothetical protein